LLSDYQHKTTEAYDVVLPVLAGRGLASKRAAFVIDKAGIIWYSEETPTPGDLPNFVAIIEVLQSL
jgi:peroxiredoxin